MKPETQVPEPPRIAEAMIERIEQKFSALYPNLEEGEKALCMLEIIEKYLDHYLRVKNVPKVHNSTPERALEDLGRMFYVAMERIHTNAKDYEADTASESQDTVHTPR